MSQIYALSLRDPSRGSWNDIYDPDINDDDILVRFSLERGGVPHSAHLFHRRYWSATEIARNIGAAQATYGGARAAFAAFEPVARRHRWYDSERYGGVAEHAAACGGLLIASGSLLYRFLAEVQPFRENGYYVGDQLLFGSEPINVNDPRAYRP